jgi:hypothetical protein
MEADCPKNISLLFEEFYCRNVDTFGIVMMLEQSGCPLKCKTPP